MQASRLLSILILIQVRGRMSASALAREFEVSTRTIHRDIDKLSAAGVPVYAERGRDGGFALLDGYQTRLTGLTAREAEVMLLAGLGAAAADLGVGAELAAAQMKLVASLPKAAGARAQQISDRFHFDLADWYRRAENLPLLPTIASAVWRAQRLRVTYSGWEQRATRTLDPLGLVLKAGIWYLVAAAKGRPSTYRVSNFVGVQALDQTFARPKQFALARYWSGRVRVFEALLLKETARVRISPKGVKWLSQISQAAADAVERNHRPCGAGWVEADIPIEGVEFAFGQLLRLGGEVEILSPPELRQRLVRELNKINALYRTKSNDVV